VKIGYVSADFGVPIFGNTGNAVHVRELIEALRRAGHEVHLVSPAFDPASVPAAHRFRPEGAAIELTPVAPARRHVDLDHELELLDSLLGRPTRVRHELRNLLYNLTLHQAGHTAFRRAEIDVIYERYAFASVAGQRLARELGVPHLLEVNAPLSQEQERRAGVEMKDLARDLERRLLCDADHLFVVSRALLEFAQARGADARRISVLPNAVDPERFRASPEEADSMRRHLGVQDQCVIGFAGGLKAFHGTETLVEAFASLRRRRSGLHLLIVGDGPERERLMALAREQGVAEDVTFTGAVTHAEVPIYISSMDIAVAPGVARSDYYFSPLKLFEYMSLSRAVVAGAVGQMAELIRDGEDGRLFPPGDAAALDKVLEELVAAPPLRHALGTRARARIEAHHTWDHNAARVLDVAQRLAHPAERVHP
jgi:glycosyltransferase involved in cell wall biosynthesis